MRKEAYFDEVFRFGRSSFHVKRATLVDRVGTSCAKVARRDRSANALTPIWNFVMRWLHAIRVVFAFLIAPVAGALTFAGASALSDHIYVVPFQRISIFTFTVPLIIGGYPPAVLLGVPAYFLLRNRVKVRLATIMFVGGLIAGIPWFIISTLMILSSTRLSEWAAVNYETTIPAFGCGCVSGFVFWLTVGRG